MAQRHCATPLCTLFLIRLHFSVSCVYKSGVRFVPDQDGRQDFVAYKGFDESSISFVCETPTRIFALSDQGTEMLIGYRWEHRKRVRDLRSSLNMTITSFLSIIARGHLDYSTIALGCQCLGTNSTERRVICSTERS